jgi:hypothetical protein
MDLGGLPFRKRVNRRAPAPLRERLRRGFRAAPARARLGLPPVTLRIAAVAVLALFGIALVLALSTPGDDLSNLGRNLLTTFAVALLAYVWFYLWTSYHAIGRLRKKAVARPASLFPSPPRVGRAEYVIGRDALIKEIFEKATDESGTRPQLIVGDTGSGKTSLLLALAEYFAKRGILPIVVSLRDFSELDFFDIARARFNDYVNPHLRSDADTDKVWRSAWRAHKIVLLADDLDRTSVPGLGADPYKTAARLALDAAARRQLPLVITSRIEGLPHTGVTVDVTELGPLDLEAGEAAEIFVKRLGRAAEERNVLRENIERGKLTVNPFYLGVAADLLRLRSLESPPNGGEHAVRVALMEAWHKALLGGSTVAPQERARREQMLDLVSDFAAARLPREGPQVEPQFVQGKWLQALHAAEHFDLLEVDEEGEHRFKHDAMHAYFGSRALHRNPGLLDRVLKQGADAPRVQLALVFAAAATHDHRLCEKACTVLLATSESVDERQLLRAGAAAEIARAGGFHDLDERIAETCVQARHHASTLMRRSVLEQLSKLSGKRAVTALWAFVDDEDYTVRWAAAGKLVERCSATEQTPSDLSPEEFVAGAHAYLSLSTRFERHLHDAEGLSKPLDDWVPKMLPLKLMAWILPTLRTGTKALRDRHVDELVADHLNRLIALERKPVTRQKGLEASLAQGFKVDAQRNRLGGVDDDALELLDRAKFWYSQLNLVHAITLREANAEGPPKQRRSVSALLHDSAEQPAHPFLRAAAKLCDEGLAEVARTREPNDIDRYVWGDEGELVSGSPPDGLHDAAIQLVGDIVVLLNMNETSGESERERFGTNDRLPFCIKQSVDRKELLRGCVGEQKCGLGLCPYQPALNRLSAHREISRAFCAHQRRNASAHVARRWGSRVKERALREFWGELESRARM